MKTKIKKQIYLFAAAFLFLSVFFVGVDRVNNVTKAYLDADCMAMYDDMEYCETGDGSSSGGDYNGDYDAIQGVDTNGGVSGNTDYDNCIEGTGDYSYCADLLNSSVSDFSSSDNMDNFQTTNPVDSGGNSSNCDPSPSCWWYNCCSNQDATYTETRAQTPEELAAAQKAELEKNSAVAYQNNLVRKVDTANAAVQGCTNNCAELQEAARKANEELLAANAKAEAAIADYQASAQAAGLISSDSSGGSTYLMCANGIIGTICEGGGGTVISGGYNGGYSNGNYSSGSGLPGSYVAGINGATTPKCGTNFTDVGGVCFPTNTGLSAAPIYVILSNIFSWLMGLFTTLAVVAFVISGVQYLMAAGNEDLAKTAKQNAVNAIIGIIVGLSGFIIIKAVAAALSGQGYFF